MAYTHTTRAAFRSALRQRLHDTGGVYWSDTELNLYIDEALYTMGAVGEYWKVSGTLATSANTAFYDLNGVSGSVLTRTLTDSTLLQVIQGHLLEPIIGTAWSGTDQFNLTEITNAIQYRRDRFLLETGMVLSHSTQVLGAFPADGRVSLDEGVLDVRRVCWVNSRGDTHSLYRSDAYGETTWAPTWVTASADEPETWDVYTTPTVTLQLFPIHNAAGTLDLVTVSAGAALNPASSVALGIPNGWAWVVKWGALATLLGKEGPGRDVERAQACEERWRQGVELAKMANSIVTARISGVPVLPTAIGNADAEDGYWQGRRTGTPEEVLVAGHNLVAMKPVPDGVYTVTYDVIRNAPVPTADTGAGSYIDVGKDHLDILLDYCEHLAAFKMGGADFKNTQREAENFLMAMALLSRRDRAVAVFKRGMQVSDRESWNTPSVVTEGPPGQSAERY